LLLSLLLPSLLPVVASAVACFAKVVESYVAFVASSVPVCDGDGTELDAVVSSVGAAAKVPTDVLVAASTASVVAVTFPVVSSCVVKATVVAAVTTASVVAAVTAAVVEAAVVASVLDVLCAVEVSPALLVSSSWCAEPLPASSLSSSW
jgi:hypothetical protein